MPFKPLNSFDVEFTWNGIEEIPYDYQGKLIELEFLEEFFLNYSVGANNNDFYLLKIIY